MTNSTPRDAVEAFLITHPDTDLTWIYEAELPLDRIDVPGSLTNQVRSEPLDQPTVERYVDALAAGDVFPPIIVRPDPRSKAKQPPLVVLGGNHRTAAYLDAGRLTITAYVVGCSGRTALELAVGDNATHGLPPTDADRTAHALRLIDLGRSPGEAARTAGIKVDHVYRRQRADRVLARAARLHVQPQVGAIIYTVQNRLDAIEDDRVFVAVAKAFAVHQFGQVAAFRLLGDLNAQSSVKDQLELLQVNLDHHRSTAKVGRGAGRPPTNPYLVLRGALGTVRGVHPSDVLVACRTPRERAELARLCLDGARHLKAIHDLAQLPATEVA